MAPTALQRGRAALFVAASALLSALPRGASIPAARAAGRAFYYLLPARRRVAHENLEAALGREVDAAARRRIAIASFGHAAAMAADLLTLPRVARDPRATCEVPSASLAALEEAERGGRGVIVVAGHFGLFESMGIALGSAGHPVTFVAKPFANPALDAAVNARRSATGNAFIHKGGAKSRAREVLAGGGRVAIVVDQHVSRRDRLWVPFFGVPAATTRSLGTLAFETGAPVVPIHSFPQDGGRCRCEFGPVLWPGRGGLATPEDLVHAVVLEMERATRRLPEAWLWLHRRWKVRPRAELGQHPAYSVSEEEELRRQAARAVAAAAHE